MNTRRVWAIISGDLLYVDISSVEPLEPQAAILHALIELRVENHDLEEIEAWTDDGNTRYLWPKGGPALVIQPTPQTTEST